MQKDALILVAGTNGLIGSAVVRKLSDLGYHNVLTPSRNELNLLRQDDVASYFCDVRPEYVFHAAGRVGGIYANNTYRADFIYENIQMTSNIIHQSFEVGVKRLMNFGCNCMYPSDTSQPMQESQLGTGSLEDTSEAFAMAKLAGVKMCEAYNRQYGTDFLSVIPSNVYGINQSYEPLNSMVIPSLINRFYDAHKQGLPSITVWGTGEAIRDFLFVDDLADASIFLMNNYLNTKPINIASGQAYSIAELAFLIKEIVGYQGKIIFDNDLLGGADKKTLDVSKMKKLGWLPKYNLRKGLENTIANYIHERNEGIE